MQNLRMRLGQNLLVLIQRKAVVHGRISLCSSRIVETLATYRKLDTSITHLQYLDFSVRLLPLPHRNNKPLWNTGKIKSAPVPGAPVIVSALIYKQ